MIDEKGNIQCPKCDKNTDITWENTVITSVVKMEGVPFNL